MSFLKQKAENISGVNRYSHVFKHLIVHLKYSHLSQKQGTSYGNLLGPFLKTLFDLFYSTSSEPLPSPSSSEVHLEKVPPTHRCCSCTACLASPQLETSPQICSSGASSRVWGSLDSDWMATSQSTSLMEMTAVTTINGTSSEEVSRNRRTSSTTETFPSSVVVMAEGGLRKRASLMR